MAVVTFSDITERRRAESAALQLAAIVESSADAVIGKDLNGIVTSWNDAAERIFGYSADEMVGRSITTIIPAGHQDDEEQILSKIKRGERVEHFETERLSKDGALIAVSVTVSPIKDSHGRVIGASKLVRNITGRMRSEVALRESEERFRLLVEGVHEYAIVLLDREGTVVSWNAGAERLKGFKGEEILGRPFSVFYPPQDVAAGVPARELKLAAEEGRWEGDGWRVRADGTRFWANMLITALKDDAGNLRGFSKLTRDITERKEAEEALLKAGALQSAIFNSANFSSIATDAKGVIQIFNVGAERMLGYTAAEVMNKITPADISDPQEVIARAEALSLELGTPITPGFEALVFKASRRIEDIYELTYIRKDGSRFPAVVSVTALRDAQDAIIGYLLIGTDNTARKQAEEALLKAGALQSAIFNSANFSSIATDAKGVIQIFNVGAERMLGYTAAEVMNKITPADISDPQEVIARAEALSLELGTPITPGFEALVFKASRGIEDIYELTYIRKDGSRLPAVVSVTALRNAEDAIIGYLLIGTDNTARKQAEEALLKAGALQRAIFNSANFSSIATDAKGVIQIFNVGAERMLGYTAADVMNKITPADISDPQEVIARAQALTFELGTPITPGFEALVFKASRGIEDIYELTYIRKDGSRFPAVVSVTALRDAQDAIIGYLLIGTDNTARKEAEEALLKAGTLQRAIFNSANFSSIATDAKGVIQIFNVGAERMLGYTAAEVMNKITPADISDPREVIARADALTLELATPITPGFEALVFKASRGIEDIYELTYVRKDGSRFPAVVSVTALRDGQDAIIGYLLIGTDNTARQQAADALRKSEAQLQTIVENLDEGVIVSDLKGQLLHSNRAAQVLHGHASLDECRHVLGEFSDTFELSGIDGTALSRDQWPLARILRGEKLRGVEVGIRRIHADWHRVFSYGGTLVQDARGQSLMAVVTISDITERRQAADLIHQLNTDLEQRVVERTTQLQTANNELEAFSYSVSHDLRAPLRSLDGFSQALLEDCADKLDPEGQDNLRRIRGASQRMGHLIDDLLNLSRLTRVEMNRQTVDLSKIAHEVADELRAAEPQREVSVVIAEGLVAQVDPQLLRIALTNLLSNAWKFTAKRPDARIEFGCAGEEGTKAFFVRDNGVGFDMAYAGKLFGAFQRLHAMNDFPGTGIGLVTVQRIIHRHGGRIWADSAVDAGATFHFTL